LTALAYEGRGTRGPLLLLVHGFPADRRMWRGLMAELAGAARVVAVDLPGFGDSPPPAGDTLGMDEMADAALEVADALGGGRVVLGGLSMGGYVALAAARRHRARLAGLLLFDTRAEADTPEGAEGRRTTATRVLAEGIDFFVERSRPLWFTPETLAGRPAVVAAVDAMAARASRQGVAAALRGMAARPDTRPHLATLRVPTLVVCGRQDPITPPESMRAMAAAIPGAVFAEVPGAHFSPVEHPAEVAAEVAAFLTRLR
jgi:pimeloyl-ACP methyl ester carboxylesterase